MLPEQSKVQWTDIEWNPVNGCSVISEGCHNCYGMREAHDYSGPGELFEDLTEMRETGPCWTGKVECVEEALKIPFSWTRSWKVFVNARSDLFHRDVPVEFIDKVFKVMAQCPQHTFQILTKRPERMQQYMAQKGLEFGNNWSATCCVEWPGWDTSPMGFSWPLPNVWLGVSVENRRTAAERIPYLAQTPAAIRWLSVAPLLAPIDFMCCRGGRCRCADLAKKPPLLYNIDWVTCSGETGPNARPLDIKWIYDIVQQCQDVKVPIFVKQLGSNAFQSLEDGSIRHISFKHEKGGDPVEWPENLRIREYPSRKKF